MYNLSDKQKQALLNMGKVLGKGEEDIDDYFSDKESFQKYFDSLKEQIEKKIKSQKRKANFNKAVELGKVDLKVVTENREKRILEYYNNPSNLKQKGLEYHFKYSTSRKKLRDWMLGKTKNNIELVDSVLSNCIINEEIFIRPIIQLGIKKGLSDFEILQKLREKGFDDTLSKNFLVDEKELGEVSLNPQVVHNKIRELLRKGQSRYNIESEIKYKFKFSQEEVKEYLKDYDFDDNFAGDAKLKKEIESLRKKGKKDFEIIGICLGKKFDYKKIQEQLKRT